MQRVALQLVYRHAVHLAHQKIAVEVLHGKVRRDDLEHRGLQRCKRLRRRYAIRTDDGRHGIIWVSYPNVFDNPIPITIERGIYQAVSTE